MFGHKKIGRNDLCPCGSGHKYKKCCKDKTDWDTLLTLPPSQQLRYLSLRGKNILFLERIASALQLDKIDSETNFVDLKRAFTPNVVRQIYEDILEIWPDGHDCMRCLSQQREDVTALYTGTYEPEIIFRAIIRHSIYSDRIILSDPFLHPLHVRDDFNTILHPEINRTNAIKWSFLWISLAPWINMGLVNFIRTPGDFDPREYHEILEVQREKLKSNPELEEILDRDVDKQIQNTGILFDQGLTGYYFLSHSDDQLVEMWRHFPKGPIWKSEDEFLQFIKHQRDMHPYYVERLPGQKGEFLHHSSGVCYEAAKRICDITNSHIITDMAFRWKEVEFDHQYATGHTREWSPFAKALQNADLKILNNIPIQSALQIRKENRLEQMRLFFNRIWRTCRCAEPFSEDNAINLAAELDERVHEAESEWQNIDKQLLKWLGGTLATLVSSSVVGFTPAAAAAVVTGSTGLALAQWQRKSFKNRFPAGFFLGIKQ
jgi:hypothetical protein